MAACERIFPANESGPGGRRRCDGVHRPAVAGPYGQDKNRYTKRPSWDSSGSRLSGQETPRKYRAGIRKLGRILPALHEQQDARLRGLEKTYFFQLLRQHTIEGMFCDPMHGGNAGLIGWQMLGYPGPQMNDRAQMR